jgi:WD40 repeat protein
LAVIGTNAGASTTATFTPDGKRIVTASLSGVVQILDADTSMQIAEIAEHGNNLIGNISFSSDRST